MRRATYAYGTVNEPEYKLTAARDDLINEFVVGECTKDAPRNVGEVQFPKPVKEFIRQIGKQIEGYTMTVNKQVRRMVRRGEFRNP
jgi:hypothetical protein